MSCKYIYPHFTNCRASFKQTAFNQIIVVADKNIVNLLQHLYINNNLYRMGVGRFSEKGGQESNRRNAAAPIFLKICPPYF